MQRFAGDDEGCLNRPELPRRTRNLSPKCVPKVHARDGVLAVEGAKYNIKTNAVAPIAVTGVGVSTAIRSSTGAGGQTPVTCPAG